MCIHTYYYCYRHNYYFHMFCPGLCSPQLFSDDQISDNNFAICFLLGIPLRGSPFRTKSFEQYDFTIPSFDRLLELACRDIF